MNASTRVPLFHLLALAAVVGCGERSATRALDIEGAALAKATLTDPLSTWRFPLADGELSLRSDRLYSDGSFSVYANGVCGVTTGFFATTANSNSGDVTLQTSNPMSKDRKCTLWPRTVTIDYGDGSAAETSGAFFNLHEVENTTYSIPVGTTVPRFLAIHGTTRCDALQFGKDANSDLVLVTRLDSRTWHAVSQAAPNDRAFCNTNGQTYHLQVDFTITSDRDLP